MATDDPKAPMRGALIGMAVVFALVALASLALGADLGIAIVVGAAVGLFVGGGLGFMIAGRAAQER